MKTPTQQIQLLDSARTKNHLSHARSYQLTRWVETNQEGIKRLTQEQIAKQATAELGWPATEANVRQCAVTLGIEVGYKNHRVSADKKMTAGQARILARGILALYSKLGETALADLEELAQ